MNQSASFTSATQEDISHRAREIWERYGRPEGRDTEIWLEAERQLLGVDDKVEGSGDTAISASAFDEATSHDKPRTRIGKSSTSRKPGASVETPSASPKATAEKPAKASKSAGLARAGGAKDAIKAPSTVRPKR